MSVAVPLREYAFRLVRSEEYAIIMGDVMSQMSEILLTTDPLNDVALRHAALRREAAIAIDNYIRQLAEGPMQAQEVANV